MTRLSVVVLTLITLSGCGGGGSGPTPALLRSDQIEVAAAASATKKLGDLTVTVPAQTFATAATLTVKQYDPAQTPFRPPTPNLAPGYPTIEIATTTSATKALTFSVPKVTGKTAFVAKEGGDGWELVPSAVHGTTVTFSASFGSSRKPLLAFGTMRLIIGWVKDNLPDTSLSMHLVAGSGALGENSVILIHGLFDNYASMTGLGRKLVDKMGFRNTSSRVHSSLPPERPIPASPS